MKGLYVAEQVAVVVGLDLADKVTEFVKYLFDLESAAQRVGPQPQTAVSGQSPQMFLKRGDLLRTFQAADTQGRRCRRPGDSPVGPAQRSYGAREVRVVADCDGGKPGIARGGKIGIFDFINLQLTSSF